MKECALRFQFLRSEQFSPNCSGGSSGTDQLVQSMDGFSGHFPRAYSHHRNDDGRRSRSGWRGPWAGQGGAMGCGEESQKIFPISLRGKGGCPAEWPENYEEQSARDAMCVSCTNLSLVDYA